MTSSGEIATPSEPGLSKNRAGLAAIFIAAISIGGGLILPFFSLIVAAAAMVPAVIGLRHLTARAPRMIVIVAVTVGIVWNVAVILRYTGVSHYSTTS